MRTAEDSVDNFHIFIPARSCECIESNWPLNRWKHLADNWRGVFWFLLIYFADKSSSETLSPRRSNLNSNGVHLHRDLVFSLRPGGAGFSEPLE